MARHVERAPAGEIAPRQLTLHVDNGEPQGNRAVTSEGLQNTAYVAIIVLTVYRFTLGRTTSV